MSKHKQGCRYCDWAIWQRTERGGIRTSVAGRCSYLLPGPPKMPSCVTMLPPHRTGIWIDRGDACPCFKRRGHGKQAAEKGVSDVRRPSPEADDHSNHGLM